MTSETFGLLNTIYVLKLLNSTAYRRRKLMSISFRSKCPINTALDLIGDKWSLLIMRDLVLNNKRTFKEFSNSDEKIATNILSNRLKMLEAQGIITKSKSLEDKKVNIYSPTPIGMDLVPVLVEMALWSGRNKMKLNPEIPDDIIELMKNIKKNQKEVRK